MLLDCAFDGGEEAIVLLWVEVLKGTCVVEESRQCKIFLDCEFRTKLILVLDRKY